MLSVDLGRHGSPVAVNLAGQVDGEAALLAAGMTFQALTQWHDLPPEIG